MVGVGGEDPCNPCEVTRSRYIYIYMSYDKIQQIQHVQHSATQCSTTNSTAQHSATQNNTADHQTVILVQYTQCNAEQQTVQHT